jgi:hypothetical protein
MITVRLIRYDTALSRRRQAILSGDMGWFSMSMSEEEEVIHVKWMRRRLKEKVTRRITGLTLTLTNAVNWECGGLKYLSS